MTTTETNRHGGSLLVGSAENQEIPASNPGLRQNPQATPGASVVLGVKDCAKRSRHPVRPVRAK